MWSLDLGVVAQPVVSECQVLIEKMEQRYQQSLLQLHLSQKAEIRKIQTEMVTKLLAVVRASVQQQITQYETLRAAAVESGKSAAAALPSAVVSNQQYSANHSTNTNMNTNTNSHHNRAQSTVQMFMLHSSPSVPAGAVAAVHAHCTDSPPPRPPPPRPPPPPPHPNINNNNVNSNGNRNNNEAASSSSNRPQYKCQNCLFSCDHKSVFAAHTRACEFISGITNIPTQTVITSVPASSSVNGISVSSVQQQMHVQKQQQQPQDPRKHNSNSSTYPCHFPGCGKTFSTPIELELHIIQTHSHSRLAASNQAEISNGKTNSKKQTTDHEPSSHRNTRKRKASETSNGKSHSKRKRKKKRRTICESESDDEDSEYRPVEKAGEISKNVSARTRSKASMSSNSTSSET